MSFNEKQFRQLADETRKTVVALGTTSECVLKRHEKITEMLVEHLKKLDIPFERDICFTDHVDYGVKLDWNDKKEIQYRDGMPMANVYYPEYFETIKELQYLYGDLIAIKKGMEFGVQVHTISQYEKLFVKYPFDFIILSVHQIDNLELWTQDFQKGKSQKEYNEKYYQELLEIVKQYKNYSVLGHLDIIIRYDKNGTYFEAGKKPLLLPSWRYCGKGRVPGGRPPLAGCNYKLSYTAEKRPVIGHVTSGQLGPKSVISAI